MSLGRVLLFSLTIAVFLLAGFALWGTPPPLWVPLSLGGIYLGVVVAGTLNLRWEMYGDAICSVSGAGQRIALTFDDGPDPESTPLVLEKLRAVGAHATFFVVGKKVERHPAIVKAIVEGGHSLGVHSYFHHRFYAFLSPELVRQDIERTRDVVEKATGIRPLWFRPPIGQMSPRTVAGAKGAHALVVGWSVRARDGYRRALHDRCWARVEKGLKPGAIVLLHDAWENSDSKLIQEIPQDPSQKAPMGVQILDKILEGCKKRKLQVVVLEELVSGSRS